MAQVQHISDDQFESEVLQSSTPVLVDFWAPWCGPCRSIAPHLEELSEEMPQVKICKINIDDNTMWAGRLGVMSIPTLIVYKDGESRGKQVGALSKAELKAFIESNI